MVKLKLDEGFSVGDMRKYKFRNPKIITRRVKGRTVYIVLDKAPSGYTISKIVSKIQAEKIKEKFGKTSHRRRHSGSSRCKSGLKRRYRKRSGKRCSSGYRKTSGRRCRSKKCY